MDIYLQIFSRINAHILLTAVFSVKQFIRAQNTDQANRSKQVRKAIARSIPRTTHVNQNDKACGGWMACVEGSIAQNKKDTLRSRFRNFYFSRYAHCVLSQHFHKVVAIVYSL